MTIRHASGKKQILLEPWQAKFFESTKRYPGFVGGWGTGKTLCALLKGILLSRVYPDNLGLIVRKVYKDLKDSTLKDFERYTSIHVPTSSAEAKIYDSKVLFRHGDDLSGLQNINLGWFYIEQAEEFDTSDEFNMLRGRLRRQLTVDPKFRPSKTGPYAHLENFMATNALRQGMVIANANGHNWVWHNWIGQPQEEFDVHMAKTSDNARNLPADFVRDLDSMRNGTETERRKWRMYVNNEQDDIDLEGAYYATLMSEARRDTPSRIGKYPPDRSVATNTVWDLGIGDTTAIIWFQQIGREKRHVHSYENNGEPLEHYVRYVRDTERRLGLHYGKHFWPHDGKKRDLSTGKELSRTAADMGLRVTLIPREQHVTDGIERCRKMLPDCTFDEVECKRLIEALEHYQRRKNSHISTEEKTVFSDSPLHDWSSNLSDAFRVESAAVRRLGGGMTKERLHELLAAYT